MLKIKRIVCPLDFSDFSAKAYEYASSLAGHYRADLSVVHVIERVTSPFPTSFSPELLDRIFGELKASAESHLQEFVNKHDSRVTNIQLFAQTGFIAETILALAKRQSADLIVMGTHGRRGWDHFVLGSVTEQILQKATCPVLAVRKPTHDFVHANNERDGIELKKLLFCADFSGNSALALKYAISLATEYNAELTLVHVLEDLPRSSDIQTASAEIVCRLENLVSREARRRCAVHSLVRVGKSYEQIVQLALDSDTDLVVMGVLGRNAIDLALFGSTTHRVLQLGRCPVLVVPPEARVVSQDGEPSIANIKSPVEELR